MNKNKSGGIEDDGSDHAEEHQVEPRNQGDINDDADVKENIEQFAVGRFVFILELIHESVS